MRNILKSRAKVVWVHRVPALVATPQLFGVIYPHPPDLPSQTPQAWECWAELYHLMFNFGIVMGAQVSRLFSAYAPWALELWVSTSPVLKLHTFHTTWSLNISQPP